MKERLVEVLNKYFEIGDSDSYHLTRDKSAFAIGTMTLEDFVEFDEESTSDLADYLLSHGVIVPPVKVGDTVWVVERDEDGYHDDICGYMLIGASNDVVICSPTLRGFPKTSTLLYHIEKTRNDYNTQLCVFPLSDCYATRDEAEKALEEMK